MGDARCHRARQGMDRANARAKFRPSCCNEWGFPAIVEMQQDILILQ